MRRVLLALIGTALATTILIGLKSPTLSKPLGLEAPYESAPVEPDPTGDANQPGGTTPARPKATPTRTSAPGTTSKPGTTSPPKPGRTTSTTTTAPPRTRTITGPAVAAVWHGANYGNMQVKIIVTGTHIDDIVTIAQSNRPKTVSSTLRAQALTAQSANVGNVSGATASSDAYKKSLAGAIAQL